MPPAAGLGGARPPGITSKSKNGLGAAAGPSKPDLKALRDEAAASKDEDGSDDEETTTDDSSDEEAAFEMDGQELWTQTYCLTCDCLIEPGEGISKATTSSAAPPSPITHTTLKSRSGTIKARSSDVADTNADEARSTNPSKQSPTATRTTGASPLKRTHSAGRLHAKAGTGALGPHKRTGSAGSRLHALSELRPTTKLHDDKGKAKASTKSSSASRSSSRPGSAASNRSQNNSSGPSSLKSNEAVAASNANTSPEGQARAKKRGFLGGLGLTPAALKQQEAELAAKRKAPTPLYCSERCRLIDERRSSGLGELTQYLSQPLGPPVSAAWAAPPPPTWTRSASVSSVPLANTAYTPGSDCLCPECMDKYADGSSADGAGIPSGASDTATESSNGNMYARGPAPKPRTASGRLITPLGLHSPHGGAEGYFPQYVPSYAMTSAGQNSPRIRNLDMSQLADSGRSSNIPARSSSAASGGRASTAGTSSESGSSLWEPRLKPRADSGTRNGISNRNGYHGTTPNGYNIEGNPGSSVSGFSTKTATPAITPRQSMIVPHSPSGPLNTAKFGHRLSVPGFAPTHEVDEEAHPQPEGANRAKSPVTASSLQASSQRKRSSLLLGTSPLKLLDKSSQHHAAPSVDLFSEHVGSPGARSSLLSRSLASEYTLTGASGITLRNQQTPGLSSSHEHAKPEISRTQSQMSQHALPARRPSALSQSFSSRTFAEPSHMDLSPQRLDDQDGLSMVVGSLKLAQSRTSGPPAPDSRRGTDASQPRPADSRRLSLFGVASAPTRRDSSSMSIHSSNSGSNSSGWLRSLSSAWLNWRSTASPAPMQTDSDVFHTTDDSDEWPPYGSQHATRRESSASRGSGHKLPYAQKRATSMRDMSLASSLGQQSNMLGAADLSRQPSDDRSAGLTPTQSLVARPSIRRGHVPAYVSEIGQKGGIPGDASQHADARADEVAAADPAQRLERARVDSFTRITDADAAQKKASRRRSRDISVLPPLLAPISRCGSSNNLYAQMPRSTRAYSAGRAWTAANTPQMYVGSAGSSHQQASGGTHGQPPQSPTLLRSPYHSSLALTQDASRAAPSPSRPNSAAGYHSMPYSAGTSPRAKGLGWGAMTSIASPPTSSASAAFPSHSTHRQSISYGHAAAIASRQCVNQAQRQHRQHQHGHQHLAHGIHHPPHHHVQRNSYSSSSNQQVAANPGGDRAPLGHVMNLGALPNSTGQPVLGRHSTMPVTMHRSPTPSVPEDGGEMSAQDLTSGDFVSRPNSAMASGRRHHRTSLMPPPRSRSSLGMHPHRSDASSALTPASEDVVAENGAQHPEPPRTWSYDHLSGLKTYPVLTLPDRETHDVYDAAWGLDAGGLAKHLGQDARTSRVRNHTGDSSEFARGGHAADDGGDDRNTVQMGFQPHRKKLFYFDA